MLLYLGLACGGGDFSILMTLEVESAVFVPFGLEDVRFKVLVDFGCVLLLLLLLNGCWLVI